MKKILLLFLVLSPFIKATDAESFEIFSADQQVLTESAQAWIVSHIEPLTPEQKQIILNMLCVLRYSGMFEIVRYDAALLGYQAYLLEEKVHNYQDAQTEIAQISNNIDQINKIMNNRLATISTQRYAESYIDNLNDHLITQALDAIQEAGQDYLNKHAFRSEQSIDIHLKELNELLLSSLKTFTIVQTTQKDSPTLKVGAAYLVTRKIQAFHINFLTIAEQVAELSRQGAFVCSIFYNTLYNHMKSNALDDHYFELLFDDQGFNPDSNTRKILPDFLT